MRRFLYVLVLGLWLLPLPAVAQLSTEDCRGRRILINGANQGTDFTVGATSLTILDENAARCKVTIRNKGTAPMRCMPTQQGTPTATRGLEFLPDKQLTLETSSRPAWLCIRTTGASTIAETIEELP
jgi:hypothetical protein